MRRLFTILALFLAACSGGGHAPNSADDATDAFTGERSTYRRAVGGLGAGYLFQAHLSIGATADLLGKRVYEPEEVEALMDTTIGMGDSVHRMLGEVGNLSIGPGDRRTVARMIEVNQLLRAQATALKTFARDRTEENARAFQSHRVTTWKRLEELFGSQADEK